MNSTFIKADIFFFVTTIAIIIISICVVILSVYLYKILKDVKALSQKTKDEGERIIETIGLLREDVLERRQQLNQFLSLITAYLGNSKKPTRKVSNKTETGV